MSFEQIKVELCGSWGGDRDAANAAWASTYNKNTTEAKTDDDVMRVVSGLVHQHHDTPKERLWMEFFITCPIFIERQFDKYRMTLQYQQFSVEWYEAPMGRDHITQNELSGRYRTIPDRPYQLPDDVRKIVDLAEMNHLKDPYRGLADTWQKELEAQHDKYQAILKVLREAEQVNVIGNSSYKRAREVLRGLLGTAYLTDMRIVMNMNAFEHIVNQRLSTGAQTESRIVAQRMVTALRQSDFSGHVLLDNMIVTNQWDALMAELDAEFAEPVSAK